MHRAIGVLRHRRRLPLALSWTPPSTTGGADRGYHEKTAVAGPEQRAGAHRVFIPEICFRNDISRTAYHRLRSEGRGPRETRFGLNLIRITLEDEREWLHRLQEESAEFETQAVERAVKAGEAAVRSDKHISKTRLTRSKVTPPDARSPRVRAKRRAAAET